MDCRLVAVPASRRTSRAGARQQLLDHLFPCGLDGTLAEGRHLRGGTRAASQEMLL